MNNPDLHGTEYAESDTPDADYGCTAFFSLAPQSACERQGTTMGTWLLWHLSTRLKFCLGTSRWTIAPQCSSIRCSSSSMYHLLKHITCKPCIRSSDSIPSHWRCLTSQTEWYLPTHPQLGPCCVVCNREQQDNIMVFVRRCMSFTEIIKHLSRVRWVDVTHNPAITEGNTNNCVVWVLY